MALRHQGLRHRLTYINPSSCLGPLQVIFLIFSPHFLSFFIMLANVIFPLHTKIRSHSLTLEILQCVKCWFSVPKWRGVFLNLVGLVWTCPEFLSLLLHPSLSLSMGDSTSLPPLAFLWQPLALLGCHITPSPLCCLSFPPSHSLSPSPCLPHSLFHSPCVLSVVFGNGVIIGQPVSHFLQ